MDPKIWSKLPEELLEHIISLLPLKTVLNFRSTCKHFNSLIFSPSFQSKHSSVSQSTCSFLLLSHPQLHNQFSLYDSDHGSWLNLSISLNFLLQNQIQSSLLSSSNGLLCFSLPDSYSVFVCNILSKSSKTVKFPIFPFAFELLTLISTPTGFKIFLLSSTSSSNNAHVYDSVLQSWHMYSTFSPIRTDSHHQEGVFFNGCLYFTTSEPFSVIYFDLESGIWERMTNQLPQEQLTFVRLVSSSNNGNKNCPGDEKLYLIGGIGRNGISRSMKIWEFDDHDEETKWVEVERLPEVMCRKFGSICYHNYEHVSCFWHRGMICIRCYTWPEILYYKVSRRTWHWLPKCPNLPQKWSCGFKWFSFVPHLYALV